jgi:hypothetical protein
MDEGKMEFLMKREGEDKLQHAVAEALRSLEGARGDQASYFDLIPEEYKRAVRKIAEENHPHFKTKFASFDSFLSELSKNWLAKVQVFETLAKASGFQKIDSRNTSKEKLNRSAIACLTRSASYVLVGPGSYDSKGDRAAMRYSKIPFRPTAPQDVAMKKGFSWNQIPQKGEQLNIKTATTSPVISSYFKEMENGPIGGDNQAGMLEEMDKTIQHTFIDIDHKTIALKREPKE